MLANRLKAGSPACSESADEMKSGPSVDAKRQSSASSRKTWSFAMISVAFVLCGLSVLWWGSCSTIVSVPPDSASDTTKFGILTGHRRMYADRASTHDLLRNGDTIPYVDFTLYVDSSKVPTNRKTYWRLYDPDDPATNGVIDPNGANGNDNVKQGALALPLGQSGDSISRTLVEADITGSDRKAMVRIDYPPLGEGVPFYAPGDNFCMYVKLGDSLSNDSVPTCTAYVWKRMDAEIHVCDTSRSVIPSLVYDSLPSVVGRPFRGLDIYASRLYPDRCAYIECDTPDILVNWGMESPCLHLDTSYANVGQALWYAVQPFYHQSNATYVYLTGGADCWDTTNWGQFPAGISYWGGFLDPKACSVVFLDTIWAVTGRDTFNAWTDETRGIACIKTALHEVWHQISGDSAHLTADPYSIMFPGIGGPTTDPCFDPASVHVLRGTDSIWQFGGKK
jgi:hypothetical protein